MYSSYIRIEIWILVGQPVLCSWRCWYLPLPAVYLQFSTREVAIQCQSCPCNMFNYQVNRTHQPGLVDLDSGEGEADRSFPEI